MTTDGTSPTSRALRAGRAPGDPDHNPVDDPDPDRVTDPDRAVRSGRGAPGVVVAVELGLVERTAS